MVRKWGGVFYRPLTSYIYEFTDHTKSNHNRAIRLIHDESVIRY